MNMLIEERTISSRKAMSGDADHLTTIGVEELTLDEFTNETLPYIDSQVESGQDIAIEKSEDTIDLKFMNAAKIIVREMIFMPEASESDATFDTVAAIVNKYKTTE